jgi:major membrane immunogen (membrane-anchored lipoprotein)
MKTQLNNLFQSISDTQTETVTGMVNETVTGATHPERAFTAADLWNIQRQKKTYVRRSYLS